MIMSEVKDKEDEEEDKCPGESQWIKEWMNEWIIWIGNSLYLSNATSIYIDP